MTFADPQQKEIAEKVIRVLQSDKYKSKNFLFLLPFDTNDTPGYLELVGPPLDLQTVSTNLLQYDQYNEDTFWIDLANIFHNAIKYHSDRIATKWIAQMATSMLKYMNKERKKAENIIFGTGVVDGDGGAEGGGEMMQDEAPPTFEKKKKKNKLKIKLKQEQSEHDDQEQQQQLDEEEYVSTKKKRKKDDDYDDNEGAQKIKQHQRDVGKKHMKYKDDDDYGDDGGDALTKPSKKIKLKRQKSVESLPDNSSVNREPKDNNDGMDPPPLKKPKLKLKLGTGSKQPHHGDDASSLSPKGDQPVIIKKKPTSSTIGEGEDDSTTQQVVIIKKKKKKIPVDVDIDTNTNDLEDAAVDDDGGGKVKSSEDGTSKKPKIKLKLSIKSKKSNDDATSTAIASVASDLSESQKLTKKYKDKKDKDKSLPPVIKIKDEMPGKKLKLFQKSAENDDGDHENTNKNKTNDDDDSEMIRMKKEKKKKKLLLAAEREREQLQQEKKEKKSSKESSSKNDDDNIDNTQISTKKKDKKKSKEGEKDKSSTKLSINVNPGNRGKELPKAVVESQQKEEAAAAAAAATVPSSSIAAGSNKPTASTANKNKKSKLKLKKSLTGNNTALIKKPETATSSGDAKVRVLSPAAVTSSSMDGKKSKVSSIPSGGSGSTTDTGGGTPYAPSDNTYIQIMKQCTKVMTGLRLRQQKNIKWFATPITDKKILPEYNAKISHPMDMQTVQTNLEKGTYCKSGTGVAAFCLDIRRIFSNALQFNTLMKDSIRPVAIEILQTAEDLFKVFFSTEKVAVTSNTYTPLLYCWKLCIDILNTIYKLENPADGQPLALYFLHPVTYYCAGETPPGYSDKVTRPMDFGTVTANLVEGRYQTVEAFANDCRLVISNCLTYYDGREDGKAYMDQANRLNECLSQQLDQLTRYDKSSKAAADRTKAKEVSSPFPKPSSSMLTAILSDLRAQKYTDKATKITQPCMQRYEDPVSASTFPDYSHYIFEKMDLTIIDKKVRNGSYEMIEDFEYDVNLLFRNYEEYNTRRNTQHAVAVAKFGARKFRLLLLARYKSIEEPSSMRGEDRRDSVADLSDLVKSSQSTSPPGKKLKTETSSSLENNKKKKNGPRISITVANAAAAAAPEASPVPSSRAKSPGTKKSSLPLVASSSSSAVQPKQKASTTTSSSSTSKPNQPVPLHIAIARVKEGFPIRRAVKTLQSWEADCARYFKELMRHPWISAARPKFIFHVPVPVLFPELCDSYAAKIKYPMDLTTIECSLLSGNKYTGPEDFIQDVALVFTNAIRFNRDGRDIGDPLSCAYYDASVHLLKYSRWLSMEVLSDYVNDSDHIDTDRDDGLPPFTWSLTTGNRKRSRDEMEGLVLKEQIDISLEGDRWTWHESECEKLLKALRHQSDLKYMTFFIAPNYPHDYAAYISKPMDWEKVQRMLKKRQYRVFGDFIEDLRLIFSNALKYNAKHQGTDNVSGRAYEAAIYMSQKLESAISKMLLTVSDRLERERIDHTNAEREIEAAERAEEAQIRAAWKKETNNKDGPVETTSGATASNASLKIRNVRRVDQNRDFEIPFFDEEDNGQHESSYFEVVKFQKAMFEKQRLELLNMRKISKAIGSAVIARHIQHQMAQQWIEETTKQQQQQQQQAASNPDAADSKNGSGSERADKKDDANAGTDNVVQASTVLPVLEKEDRSLLKLKLNIPKPKVKKRKLPTFTFDTEDE